MRVGSLFAGIGGFDLAASRVWGWDCVRWQVEIDPWARRVLAKHWPNARRFEDVRSVGVGVLEPVDVLCGGFPCQDVSRANYQGKGLAGARSGLWREYARLIGELRPRYVVVENVPDLCKRGLGGVLGDLAALGFDAEWDCLPAAAFGAYHERARIWIVAYPAGERRQVRGVLEASREERASLATRRLHSIAVAARGQEPGARLACEPELARLVHGLSDGLDRRRGLGNAIVPAVAERMFRWIDEAEALA